MRRFMKSTWRYMLAAWGFVRAAWRGISSLFGQKLHPLEIFALLIGIAGIVAGQIDSIRNLLPAHATDKLDTLTGTVFGVVSASFIYKAWWFLHNHESNPDKMQDGAKYAAGGVLFLLIALNLGDKLPFTG